MIAIARPVPFSTRIPALRRFFSVSFAVLALVFALTSTLRAQENATINGDCTDSTGAVVANASITLTNTASGVERKQVSNSVGEFRFANLAIGTYTMTATAPGFETFTKTGIVVNVAQTVAADIVFKVGSQTQTVSVQANALQTQTETSEVSTLISAEQVEKLSTNGRNVTQLAALGLGVSSTLPSFGGVDALTSANSISFNGTRNTHNVYLIDGGEQNDRGCGGCFMNLPAQDAIAEFQTLDSNYPPDYGIGSGGTIVMALKSGGHDFHGELYEFNRNTAYNANDYFVKRRTTGNGRPIFQLNEPGGNIGGPLFIPHVYNENRNRTFFFWNEEWRRLILGSTPLTANTIPAANFPTAGTNLTYVPWNNPTTASAACNAGVQAPCVPKTTDPAKLALYAQDGLTAGERFPGNVIPANLMDPNAVLELNSGTFPKPNLGTSQYTASIPQPDNIREDVIRIDHTFSSKYQLMGHYLHDAMAKQFFPPLWGNSSYPTVGTAMTNPSYTAVIRLTQTYSPSLLNETGVFYAGNKITLTPIAGKSGGSSFVQPSGWSAVSLFPTANNRMARMPEIQLQGTPINTTWSPSYFPWKNGYEGFQYKDDLSWTKGRHQFKFGFSWLHAYKNQELQANTNGTAIFNTSAFSGDSYVNFLLGDTANFSQLEYLAGKHWVTNTYSGYGMDNWHVNRNLTLNLGIRYDDLPHTFERYDAFSNFVVADYDTSKGNPVDANGRLITSQLSTFSKTGNELFYLNGIREAGVGGFPRGNVENFHFTWQPRVGFAYNIRGDGKTVLRGGYGVFFERVQGNDVYNAALNPPFAYQPSADSVYFSDPHTSALNGQTASQQYFPSNLTNIKYHYPPPGTSNYSLGIQREVAPSVVAVVQYVGSNGWDQNNDRQINTLPVGDITHRQAVAGGAPANPYRNFPGFANINQEENETNFHYSALQTGIRFENKHGLTSQLAYTWSHEIDTATNDLNGLSNPYNTGYDRASGGLDRRQIFNASFVYALPFYNHSDSVLAREVIGGWSVSGIALFESGIPQVVRYSGGDTVGLGGGTTNRPNQTGKMSYPKKQTAWFDKSKFTDPVAPWNGGPTGVNAGFGNAGRDAVTLPGLENWNLSLFKSIPFKEGGPRIELRFESFNTFNHTQFQNLDLNNHDGNFGQTTGIYQPRALELGGKFIF
jgi:hypothetical protein